MKRIEMEHKTHTQSHKIKMMNNKLIAEFMGYTFVNGVYESPKDEFHIDEMLYDTSWDWLMPVVERINDLTDDWGNTNDLTIGNGFVWVDPHLGDRIFFSGNNPEDKKEPMISKVYRGVVSYIEHINSKS